MTPDPFYLQVSDVMPHAWVTTTTNLKQSIKPQGDSQAGGAVCELVM